MVKKVIGGHFNFVPKICEMLSEIKLKLQRAQGAIAQMLRDNAARKVGTISHVGIGTFADPRNGGGRLSEKTKEDIVKIIELEGQEQFILSLESLWMWLLSAVHMLMN